MRNSGDANEKYVDLILKFLIKKFKRLIQCDENFDHFLIHRNFGN
jgi:hypothetical protein